MRRRVTYKEDGSVRMDFHTFAKMHCDRIMRTVRQNAKPIQSGTRKAQRHSFHGKQTKLRPRPSLRRVKEFL